MIEGESAQPLHCSIVQAHIHQAPLQLCASFGRTHGKHIRLADGRMGPSMRANSAWLHLHANAMHGAFRALASAESDPEQRTNIGTNAALICLGIYCNASPKLCTAVMLLTLTDNKSSQAEGTRQSVWQEYTALLSRCSCAIVISGGCCFAATLLG